MQQVHNFRCLSNVDAMIKPGRIFRSATPAAAHSKDVELLLLHLSVRTIIDLRERKEAVADEGDRVLLEYYREAKRSDVPQLKDAAVRVFVLFHVLLFGLLPFLLSVFC